MKLILNAIFGKIAQKRKRKTIKDFQQEILLKQGRDQFKKLLKLGSLPVGLL